MTINVNIFERYDVLTRAISANQLLLSLSLVHVIGALAFSLILEVPFRASAVPILLLLFQVLVPVFMILIMFSNFLYLAIWVRPQNPLQRFLADARETLLDPERLLTGGMAILSISVFSGSFTFLKDCIPLIIPFSWDPYFAELDRALHGGYDPYVLVMQFFGTPFLTTFLNAAYHFWFFLLYFIIFMCCFWKGRIELRHTFLVANILTWTIGGNFLATVFSSAGPVYFDFFDYGADFIPLVDKLHEFAETSPVWALDVHQMLLDGYQDNGVVRGISAMPSMHVATSVLMAIFGFSLHRWVGWVLTTFAVIIMIGSVHLAWHYAIDGYLSIAIAIGCWWLARKLVRRQAYPPQPIFA